MKQPKPKPAEAAAKAKVEAAQYLAYLSTANPRAIAAYVFDVMTDNGWKLDMVGGVYYKP